MPGQQEKATALIQQGNQLRQANKPEQAAAAYQKAIDLVPAYGSLYLAIGEIYQSLKRYPEAILAYRSALDHTPEPDQPWDSLGECLLAEGQTAEAIEALSKALALHPKDPLVWYNRALAQALLAQTDQARRDLEKALVLHPTWIERARTEPLFAPLFDNDQLVKKPWWQFWKR